MPKVSGFIVPIMNPMNHVGNNRLFEPLVLLANKHDYDSENHEDANRVRRINLLSQIYFTYKAKSLFIASSIVLTAKSHFNGTMPFVP